MKLGDIRIFSHAFSVYYTRNIIADHTLSCLFKCTQYLTVVNCSRCLTRSLFFRRNVYRNLFTYVTLLTY